MQQGFTKLVCGNATQSVIKQMQPHKAMSKFNVIKPITTQIGLPKFTLKNNLPAQPVLMNMSQPRMFSSRNNKVVREEKDSHIDAEEEINVSPQRKQEISIDLGWNTHVMESAQPSLDSVVYEDIHEFEKEKMLMAQALKVDEFVEEKRTGKAGSPLQPRELYSPQVDRIFATLSDSVESFAKNNEQGTILMHSLFASEL